MMMGITDIDDKIIKHAAEHKEDPRSLADRYEEEFFEDRKNSVALVHKRTIPT